VEGLGLSLEGSTAQQHDSIRGVPGTFDRTMQAIRWIQELEMPLQVNTLASAETRGFGIREGLNGDQIRRNGVNASRLGSALPNRDRKGVGAFSFTMTMTRILVLFALAASLLSAQDWASANQSSSLRILRRKRRTHRRHYSRHGGRDESRR
jgi:hypothetical protein